MAGGDPIAELRRMLQALDQEATPAVGLIRAFTGWWVGFTESIAKAQSGLGAARSGLRGGLVRGGSGGWMDAAGDSFDTRWKLADNSMEPWATAARPDPKVADDLDTDIAETRRVIEAAIAAIQAHQANEAVITSGGPDTADSRMAKSSAIMRSAELLNAAIAAQQAALARFKQLDDHFARVGGEIAALPPNTVWNGPAGSAGQAPATETGPGPQVAPGGPSTPGGPGGSSQMPTGPAATGPAATDPAAPAPGAEAQGPAGGPTGGGPTGTPGQMPPQTGGPGLAGSTPTLTPPATGMPTVPNLPTPPQVPYAPTPAGVPYLPTAVVPPAAQTKNPGAGLGRSVIGGGGVGGGGGGGGGGKIGAFGVGKHGIGGVLDSSTGRPENDTSNAPAQAARQLNRGPLPSVPPAPTPPSAGAPAATSSPVGGSSMPPPMMPPMLGGAGEGKPKPGTASPVLQGKGGPKNRMPGVPPKLRGRSGKTDTANGFAVPASARRSRAVEAEKLDTVQLLDEEVWAVEQPAAPTAPTGNRINLRDH
ncbi:hypothetical protein [Kribbella swartbergensis]